MIERSMPTPPTRTGGRIRRTGRSTGSVIDVEHPDDLLEGRARARPGTSSAGPGR